MGKHLLKYFLLVLALLASAGLLWADCYVEVVHDTIIKIDTQYVSIVDTITIHDTCRVASQTNVSSSEHSCWWDFGQPLLVSILGAFGALYLTYLMLRPKFEIDPIATQYLNNRVWFVVRNKSYFAKLYSIKVELAYMKYDEERGDIALEPIDLDDDSSLAILQPRNSNNDSFYVFHTKEAFIRDERYEKVRLRVSATNTISNIFDTKEKEFYYSTTNTFEVARDDIRWGTLDDEIHKSLRITYNGTSLEKAQQIIHFNETVLRIFSPYTTKAEVIHDQAIWDQARELLASLKPTGDLHEVFPSLKQILPTINQINKDYEKLYKLYTQNTVLTHENKDKKDHLVVGMKRELVRIARYMQKSLNI